VVTHIRESRWFKLMCTLQGKTWPTWHICFPCQSTYARCTLPAGSPHTWQPFTSTQQSWIDSLLSWKSAPDSTSQPGWVVHGTRLSFSPNTAIETVQLSHTSVDEQATRFTGPISPACDRYVQYLLTGTNPSVLNWHRQGLPHGNPQNSHNTLPALPFRGFHWCP
jgi:hypothetical protein